MKRHLWVGTFLLCLGHNGICIDKTPEVSLRFHDQWKISESDKQTLQQKYGVSRVIFDQEGHATPIDLTSEQAKRWQRLYNLCMNDGCIFCDSAEGSCENQSCGPKNAYCKPYMETEGHPKCGFECADYAFMSTLI